MHHHSMQGSCGCGPSGPASNRRPIVCPMQHCVLDNYFVENQDYIHPTHILVQNHHMLNNNHYFPYMVSEQNSFQTQDFAFPQGSSPDYNWMDYMNPQEMGQMPMGQGQGQGQGQMPMMGQEDMGEMGQMPMMNQEGMDGMGQMPMMPGQMMGQGQMPMGQGQGQMPMGQGQGQMPMMGQGQMPMMGGSGSNS